MSIDLEKSKDGIDDSFDIDSLGLDDLPSDEIPTFDIDPLSDDLPTFDGLPSDGLPSGEVSADGLPSNDLPFGGFQPDDLSAGGLPVGGLPDENLSKNNIFDDFSRGGSQTTGTSSPDGSTGSTADQIVKTPAPVYPPDFFTLVLGLSLAAIIIAFVLLYLEVSYYGENPFSGIPKV
ncbi:MAG: hypothetical protein LBQ66_04275 [Planctomycetaceae bacterium]|jgi:hypothetical protein|nr:hypothetical protein [Planctomycetaceae bacterium]